MALPLFWYCSYSGLCTLIFCHIGEHAATIIRLQAALDQRQQEEEIVQQNNRERMDEMVDAVLENRILAEGQCAETVALVSFR